MQKKQINNGYDAQYYMTREGKVYNSKTGNLMTRYKDCYYKLKTVNGKYKTVSLKELYKLVYNEVYIKDNIENLIDEVWKPIERTDNLYWISDKGRVKSYTGYEAKILKPLYVNGYERVTIVQDGSRCNKLISRLVAAAFLIPPKDIDMQLHHKTGQKADNRAENLEWLTIAEHREKHKQMKVAELEEQEKGEKY